MILLIKLILTIIIFNMLILHWMKNQFRYNFFTEDQTVQSSKF